MIGEIVLIIIGMIMSFTAYVICSFAKPSEKQKYSSITSIAALFFFIISFMNIYSDNLDQFILCQKLTFTAGLYMLIGFGFSISYVFQVSYTNRSKLIIVIVSILFVCLFASFDNYYPWVKSMDMVLNDCGLYTFKVHGGWLYYLASGISIITLIVWLVIIIIKTASKRGNEFKVFRYLLAFVLIPFFIWTFSALQIIPSLITNELVFMILLLVIMHVEIFFTLARDRKISEYGIFDNTSNGIIVLDYKKLYLNANKSAKKLFEIFSSDNKDAITAFINVNLIGENKYFDGINTYRLKFEEISEESTPRSGYVLWICKIENKETSE